MADEKPDRAGGAPAQADETKDTLGVFAESLRVLHLAILVRRFDENAAHSAPFVRKAMDLLSRALEPGSERSPEDILVGFEAQHALLDAPIAQRLQLLERLAESFERGEASPGDQRDYDAWLATLPEAYRRVERQLRGQDPRAGGLRRRHVIAISIAFVATAFAALIVMTDAPSAPPPRHEAVATPGQPAPSPVEIKIPSPPHTFLLNTGEAANGPLGEVTLVSPSQLVTVTIRARGTQCDDTDSGRDRTPPYPIIHMRLDNREIHQWKIESVEATHFTSPAIALSEGTHALGFAFSNDYANEKCDRNVWLETVHVEPSDAKAAKDAKAAVQKQAH